MSWNPARPYVAKSGGAAKIVVNCSVQVRKSDHAVKVTFTLNQRAQEALFGGPLVGERLRLEVGRTVDQGKIRLSKHVDGVTVKAGPRGAARLAVAAWSLVPTEAHSASPLRFVSNTPEGVVFSLPSWGQPEAARAAMDGKFGVGATAPVREA